MPLISGWTGSMYIIGLLLGLISLLGVLIDSKPLEIEASQKFDAAIALINHDIIV